ncbi:MAG: hypothetical protein LBR21_02560 [Propionibacteriaceae bacterium]|jgi:hypothetical protein|nr:hypothetical protein [Propionibacteriaceae bacterium]
MQSTALPQQVEEALAQVLAERSTPGAVTDYWTSLSDEDREYHMRVWADMGLMAGETVTADYLRQLSDLEILMADGLGF